MQNDGGHGSTSGGNGFSYNYSYVPGLDKEGWLTLGNGKTRGHMWDIFYTCPYCKKTFFTSQALRGHQNAHRIERDALRKKYKKHMHKGTHAAPHVPMNQPGHGSGPEVAANQIERDTLRREYEPQVYGDAHRNQPIPVHQSGLGSDHGVATASTPRPRRGSLPELQLRLGGPGHGSGQVGLHVRHEHDNAQVYRDQMERIFGTINSKDLQRKMELEAAKGDLNNKDLQRKMELEAAKGDEEDSEATVTCPQLKKSCWCGCESAEGSDSEESDTEASSTELDLTLKL